MIRLVVLLVVAVLPGCAKWAYAPNWRGADREQPVRLVFDGGPLCGELTVVNQSAVPVVVRWERVRARLPSGAERPTTLYALEGQEAKKREEVAPGGRSVGGLCLTERSFVVRSRPLTGYDVALGWFFGTGVLAGNVAWKPDERKRERVLPNPRRYGWELVVPMIVDDAERERAVEVRGTDVGTFKYSRRYHGDPAPLPER